MAFCDALTSWHVDVDRRIRFNFEHEGEVRRENAHCFSCETRASALRCMHALVEDGRARYTSEAKFGPSAAGITGNLV